MDEKKKENIFLEVKDLSVQYTSEEMVIKAVNSVSFQMMRGKTLGFVGETGAGKTSVAKALLRILPDFSAEITSGEVWLDGVNLMTISEKQMRKIRGEKISMIFQDPMTALNPVKTVGQQIMEGIKLHSERMTHRAYKEKALEMLRMVGIPDDRFDDYPHQFSGGMRQRVVIAMALVCSPKLLLADEPTTALDVTIQAQVLNLICELKKKYDTSVILITHDLGVVAEVCDDVAVIYAGEIVEQGTLEDVFDHPSHPYTIGLFGALPDIEVERERLSPIEGLPPDPSDLPEGCKFCPRCPEATEECRSGEIPLVRLSDTHICRCKHYVSQEE